MGVNSKLLVSEGWPPKAIYSLDIRSIYSSEGTFCYSSKDCSHSENFVSCTKKRHGI